MNINKSHKSPNITAFDAYKLIAKTKVKISLCLTKYHALKTSCAYYEDVRGSGVIALCILNLDTRWRWMVTFTSLPLYPWGRAPSTHWIWGWVGPRPSVDVVADKKSLPLPGIKPPSFNTWTS